jgi:hypothetical protein
MGMLSLVLLGGLHFGRRVWEASETTTAALDRIRAFQSSLASELARTYPEIDSSQAGEASKVKFDGEKDQVSFLTSAPDGSGALVQTTVKAEERDGRVRLVEARHLELARAQQDAIVDAHLPPVVSVEFSYFGSIKDNEPASWHESWSDQAALPDLVRIHARFADKRLAWPELIVKPRVEADVSCTFDPLARACAGR